MAQYLQYRDVCEVICLFLYIVEMTSCNTWLEYEVNKIARLQCNAKINSTGYSYEQIYNNQEDTLFMGHRITVMVDDENYKKLRILQAKLLLQTNSSVSFSRVLNDTINNSLKKIK
jgi:hypothetical protein